MATVARAWDAFMQAMVEARDLHKRGAEPHEIAELLRHARQLVDVIEGEFAERPINIPGAAGAVLSQLRGRLRFLERVVGLPTTVH